MRPTHLKNPTCLLLSTLALLTLFSTPKARADDTPHPIPHIKPRLIVLTDVSNEPDDEESLVRLLVYSNNFDIEGLIATTSAWLRKNPREDLIRRDIAAYAQVRPNLLKNAPGFPAADDLLAVTKTGQTDFGMAVVGQGKSSPGSQRIIDAVDRADDRPLWITAWGGTNTLAQALSDVRSSRSPADVDKFIAKIRVYAISDQDDAGPWLRREFPNLFYVISPSNSGPNSWEEYYRAAWTGISGERNYKIGVGHHFDMVDNPWLQSHIIQNHGPLGALYPPLKYIMEGDTPSFLGLIDNGLGWDLSPAYGGWGGRYNLYQPASESHPIWTDNADSRDTVTADNGKTETSNQATIWRWREDFQNDFAARMNWCITDDPANANHNPRLTLNGNRSTDVLSFNAKPGDTLHLSADGSDPGDNHQTLTFSWWIYTEAGPIKNATLANPDGPHTDVTLPRNSRPGALHVILQAKDNGTPPLTSYRRAIIQVAP